MADYEALWRQSYSWHDYLRQEVVEHRDLWLAVDARARITPEAEGRLAALPGEWVLQEKRAGERPPEEIYRDVRRWYARDRGESVAREVLAIIENAAVAEAERPLPR